MNLPIDENDKVENKVEILAESLPVEEVNLSIDENDKEEMKAEIHEESLAVQE